MDQQSLSAPERPLGHPHGRRLRWRPTRSPIWPWRSTFPSRTWRGPSRRTTPPVRRRGFRLQHGARRPCDHGLVPAKSNWARPVSQGPFEAYPIMAANVFTFGGLKTTATAEVVDRDGRAIPGLYAAGELTGLYYSNYTGSTSVLRGADLRADRGRPCGRAAGLSMRIWHQSFTVLDDVPHYRDALARHLDVPGRTRHEDRPARHGARDLPVGLPGHPHRLRLPLRAAQGAVRRGGAARPGRGVRRLPDRHDPGHRLTRRSARWSTCPS